MTEPNARKDDPKELSQRLIQQQRLLHEHRGRMLAEMCSVEDALDFAIGTYWFPPRTPRLWSFREWVLPAIGLQAKTEIVRHIVEDLDLLRRMPTLLRDLEEARIARDRQAHSTLKWDPFAKRPGCGFEELFVPWQLEKMSRSKGRQVKLVDPRELSKEITLVHTVYLELARLATAILAPYYDHDIDESLAAFDAINSTEKMWSGIAPIIQDAEGMFLGYFPVIPPPDPDEECPAEE